MFLWNNIFLSLGFDVKDHFKDFGGDAAAYAAPVCNIASFASDSLNLQWLVDLLLPTHVAAEPCIDAYSVPKFSMLATR